MQRVHFSQFDELYRRVKTLVPLYKRHNIFGIAAITAANFDDLGAIWLTRSLESFFNYVQT